MKPTIQSRSAAYRDSPGTGAESPSILIVDDSAIDRRIAAAMIERVSPFRCEFAEDGEAALAALERERPSAVLTDLQMEGMDGLMLVKEVRRLHPAVPVVLMTGQGSEDVAMEALRAGAANYVPKRSLSRDLLPTLAQILTVAATARKRERLKGALRVQTAVWRLENDPELIAPFVEHLQSDLADMHLDDETTGMRVGVALQEALLNALYHGNLELSSELRQNEEREFLDEVNRRRFQEPYRSRSITVDVRLNRGSARYVVRDDGSGFDTTRLYRPIDPEDLLRIGGRGLLLIRAFMDEVAYNGTGNEVTLVKYASRSDARTAGA